MKQLYSFAPIAYLIKYLAFVGFVLALCLHIAGLTGTEKYFAGIKPIYLYLGMLMLFFPSIWLNNKAVKKNSKQVGWEDQLKGCPGWMKKGMTVVFIYGVVNFIYSVILIELEIKNNTPYQAMAGHWLIFYCASFAAAHSFTVRSKEGR